MNNYNVQRQQHNQITDISTLQFIRKLHNLITSSACKATDQPSQYLFPVPAGYAVGYPATSGFRRNAKNDSGIFLFLTLTPTPTLTLT